FGLADVVELGRALGQLPASLVFVGVELGTFGAGTGLSEPVLAGVRQAAKRVNDLVAGLPRGLPDVILPPQPTLNRPGQSVADVLAEDLESPMLD
ncbi:MAG: hypothetical protein ACXV5Q_13995, partial [Frankiaceae bacterium]